MARIIYYVASSLDGFIAGEADDVSAFVPGGNGIERYLKDLQDFRTVIMGRRTYEFGYQYGLQPGQPAYPHMQHHIFSNTLVFDAAADSVHVEPISIDRITQIKHQSKTDIYLCGGGTFAGWLLENEMIDQLKLKLNPIILGKGIPIFGNNPTPGKWDLQQRESFDGGLEILTYDRIAG